ncbi:MAG TPA: hypothetical protein GXX77_05190 [Candidatus Cloacimonetes bacterium]|nr:hypothetical protein [Candidatus Cloacimonadota bacterium]
MRVNILVLILLASLFIPAWGISIYEIQYTNFPGSDNTYPSTYSGKTVSTEGIVTATDYKNSGFFISETVAGPYSGLLVLHRGKDVKIGDKVRLTGVVREHFGMTSLQDVSSLEIIQRNHPLPIPAVLTTAQLCSSIEAEAYEGVYARVISVNTGGRKSIGNRLSVSDGTGACTIQLGDFGSEKSRAKPITAGRFSSITGVVTFSFGEFSLSPVSDSDIEINQPVSVEGRSWGRIKSIYK